MFHHSCAYQYFRINRFDELNSTKIRCLPWAYVLSFLHDWYTWGATSADKNSHVNTLESRRLKSTEQIEVKFVSFEKLAKCITAKIFVSLLLEILLWKCHANVGMFNPENAVEYLINYLWVHGKISCCSGTTTLFGSSEVPFSLHFQSAVCLPCAYPKFTSKISLAISLHDWFTWGTNSATDNNCIVTCLKAIPQKVLNRLKRKTSL